MDIKKYKALTIIQIKKIKMDILMNVLMKNL